MKSFNRWEYNALDCAATLQAHNVLAGYREREPAIELAYQSEMALLPAAMAISWRGILVDREAARAKLLLLDRGIRIKETLLGREAGHAVNPRSPDQVKGLLYDELEMKPQLNKDHKISTDMQVLERFAKRAVPVNNRSLPRAEVSRRKDVAACAASLIIGTREWSKLRGVVKSKQDDGRMRSTITVGAAETFRFSSTKNPFGRGTNLQNQTPALKSMYIPDPGFDMWQWDQKQAESRIVAFMSGDPGYIKAHQSLDTHTYVARLVWPEFDWAPEGAPCSNCGGEGCHACGNTGMEDSRQARIKGFYRHFSRRDLSKRVQHGSNYGGTEHMLARILHIPLSEAREIQGRYFNAFPGVVEFKRTYAQLVRREGRIVYPGGYVRQFHGRPWDLKTQRDAIASVAQSMCAWTTHIVMKRLWERFDGTFLAGDDGPDFQLLMHTHDGLLAQVRHGLMPGYEAAIAKAGMMDVIWTTPAGVEFIIPWDLEGPGANWKEV